MRDILLLIPVIIAMLLCVCTDKPTSTVSNKECQEITGTIGNGIVILPYKDVKAVDVYVRSSAENPWRCTQNYTIDFDKGIIELLGYDASWFYLIIIFSYQGE